MGKVASLTKVFEWNAAKLPASFIEQIQQVDSLLKSKGYDQVAMPTLPDSHFRRYSKTEAGSQFIVQIDIGPGVESSGMMGFIREDQPESFKRMHMSEFLAQERPQSVFKGLVNWLNRQNGV